MASYTFTLLIDAKILLKQPTDNFCIAKKVQGKFTTVFQDAAIKTKRAGQRNLLTRNDFVWEDKYRVFATVTYKHGMLVRSATNNVDVKFGEQTLYDGSQFSDAKVAPTTDFENSGGDRSPHDSFLAKTIPDTLHVSVESWASGAWVPIYVDPDQHVGLMNHQLTPLNEYMLFWSNSVETESMIDQSKCPNPFLFSFTGGEKTKTVRYGYKTADNPEPSEQADFYSA